jgi:hypothetical protein
MALSGTFWLNYRPHTYSLIWKFAILDRLVHNAYRLELKGGSMRKARLPIAAARS